MSPDQTPEDSSRSRLEVPLVGHAASHWLGAVQFALLPMTPAPTARNQPNSVRLEPLGQALSSQLLRQQCIHCLLAESPLWPLRFSSYCHGLILH